MGFGVGEAESAAPRPTDDEPAIDVEADTEALDVIDEMGSGVNAEVGIGGACKRCAAAAAALIEEDDSVDGRIEELSPPGRTAGAGTAVEDEGRLAPGIATSLPVDGIAIAH